MEGPDVLSSLSCKRCRLRKTRCSRSLPTCSTCMRQGLLCCYPKRRPRSDRTPNQTSSHINSSSVSQASRRCYPTPQSITSTESPITAAYSPRSPQATEQLSSIGASIFADLAEAVDELRKQRLRQLRTFEAQKEASLGIPPSVAKTWIKGYYACLPCDPLLGVRDMEETLLQLPDIVDKPYISVKPCILLIYYCVLREGSCVLGGGSSRPSNLDYGKQLYIASVNLLPAWQLEATASMNDFMAAMLMTRSAEESFDHDLGWKMYKLACEYSKDLKMHTLDSTDRTAARNSPDTDSDRIGMWELMHLDLFYRLLHNKPATISASINSWQVNLPTLAADLHYEVNTSIPTLSFMVRSRLTFILFRYFQLLDHLAEQQNIYGSIERLCMEVRDYYHEWQIESWIEKVKHDDVKSWILVNLALEGDTAILFMLRKATALTTNKSAYPLFMDDQIPTSDLAIEAARRNLVRVQQMLQVFKFAASETLSVLFGTCHVYLAYACVALRILQAPNASTAEPDMELLERTAECIADSSYEADCRPFAKYLHYINLQLRVGLR